MEKIHISEKATASEIRKTLGISEETRKYMEKVVKCTLEKKKDKAGIK